MFHGGSADAIGGSRFGPQTGQTHDGLLLNRSPTRLFHEAPGQFRDLDLSRCYPSVLREMNLYVGRPVVWEPGNDTLPLADVVGYLDEHAAAWDGWFVKVSGSVSGAPNVLIPSSHGALTHLNYHKRAAKQRAKAAQ